MLLTLIHLERGGEFDANLLSSKKIFFCGILCYKSFEDRKQHLINRKKLVGRGKVFVYLMTQTMKGLLKGLRYISQIFDADDEKEQEMQIGMPTDVKHVAHIGWDGPSSASPSWMNEFPASSESSSGPQNRSVEAKGNPSTRSSNKDMQRPSDAPFDSPTRRNKGKQSKRNNNIPSSNSSSVGSPSRDSSGISKPRRPKNSALGSESPSQDPSGASKKSNRKKTKGSSGGGSTRSSRTKGPEQMADNYPFSDPGPDYGPKENGINSVLEVYDEGNERDEISRGNRGL